MAASSKKNTTYRSRKESKQSCGERDQVKDLFCTSEEVNTELGQPVELALLYPLITRDRVLFQNTVSIQFQELDLKRGQHAAKDLLLAGNFKHL